MLNVWTSNIVDWEMGRKLDLNLVGGGTREFNRILERVIRSTSHTSH
jgi:hypothetical protein